MRIGIVAGIFASIFGLGMVAVGGPAQAAVLTVDLNDYDFINPNGLNLAEFKVQDVGTGGVDVTVTLNPDNLSNTPYYFASTGGPHITVGFNLDTTITAADITFGTNGGNTFTFVAGTGVLSPTRLGAYDFGLDGNWNGTSNHFVGPITFHIAGVTVADFNQNLAGYYAAADLGVLGGRFTGEAGGQVGTLSTVPEPSTWAMMLLGFAGLAFAGYRRARNNRFALSTE